MALLGISDTDVAALGGVGTLILAGVAVAQMRVALDQIRESADRPTS
jgi:hypothetical protein